MKLTRLAYALSLVAAYGTAHAEPGMPERLAPMDSPWLLNAPLTGIMAGPNHPGGGGHPAPRPQPPAPRPQPPAPRPQPPAPHPQPPAPRPRPPAPHPQPPAPHPNPPHPPLPNPQPHPNPPPRPHPRPQPPDNRPRPPRPWPYPRPEPNPWPQPWPYPGPYPYPRPYPPEPIPPQPRDIRIYSPDGSHVVEITGYERDAYLYDLRGDGPYGRFLAAGVRGAEFSNRAEDASRRQIELGFYDGRGWAAVDLDGTRKVMVSGPEREAVLYNLERPGVEPLGLAANVVGVQFISTDERADGVEVTYVDGRGQEATAVFDRDGRVPLDGVDAPQPDPQTGDIPSAGLSEKRLLKDSSSFRGLNSSKLDW